MRTRVNICKFWNQLPPAGDVHPSAGGSWKPCRSTNFNVGCGTATGFSCCSLLPYRLPILRWDWRQKNLTALSLIIEMVKFLAQVLEVRRQEEVKWWGRGLDPYSISGRECFVQRSPYVLDQALLLTARDNKLDAVPKFLDLGANVFAEKDVRSLLLDIATPTAAATILLKSPSRHGASLWLRV